MVYIYIYIYESLNFRDEFAKTSALSWLASTEQASGTRSHWIGRDWAGLCSLPPRGEGGKEIGRRAQTPFKIYPIFHRPVESWKSRAQPFPLFYFPNFRGERVGAFELARGPVPRARILSLLCSLRITRRANIFRIKFTVEK